jgi:hypothetical protein
MTDLSYFVTDGLPDKKMELSSEEMGFLLSCDPLWLELSPKKISKIVANSYLLLYELLPKTAPLGDKASEP